MDFPHFIDQPLYYIEDSGSYPHSLPLNDTLSNLALSDALLSHAGSTGMNILHIWQSNRPTVLLGMMDTKLPDFPKAVEALFLQQYDVLVRHSGGLAVPSDPGVLNFSLLIRNPPEKRLSIEEGYQLVSFLLKQAFNPTEHALLSNEVPNSYCPGDYDLTMGGKKISGLSQRRVKDGLAVMGYVSIHGDQSKRGHLLHQFYQDGHPSETISARYPLIDPSVMENVAEMIPKISTTAIMKKKLLDVFYFNGTKVKELPYSPSIHTLYESGRMKLIARNQKMMGNLFQEGVFE